MSYMLCGCGLNGGCIWPECEVNGGGGVDVG